MKINRREKFKKKQKQKQRIKFKNCFRNLYFSTSSVYFFAMRFFFCVEFAIEAIAQRFHRTIIKSSL